MTPTALLQAARGYLGVPFTHGGRDHNGLDCVGLLLAAFRDAGLTVEAPFYTRGQRGDVFEQALARQARPVALPSQRDGDVLVFAGGRYAAHLGLRSTWRGLPAVIHAHAADRVVLEEPLAARMGHRLTAVWRHLDME